MGEKVRGWEGGEGGEGGEVGMFQCPVTNPRMVTLPRSPTLSHALPRSPTPLG